MSDLQGTLERFLSEQVGVPVALSGLRRLGGGSSKEHWSFDGSWDGAAHPLLLRRDPEAGVVETSSAQEAVLLAQLAASDLPTPAVHAVDPDGSWFTRPAVVLQRLPGSAHRSVLRDKDPLSLGTGRRALAQELVHVLAAVHRVTGLDALPVSGAREELERAQREVAEVALEPLPEVALALAWLHAHLPDPVEPVLVHGDFRPANVLVQDGHVSALLDWELGHLGDPLDDLGWYTCSLYRAEHFFDGWSVQDLIDAYERDSGAPVDLESLRFWQVLSVLRLVVIALRALRSFADGTSDRPTAPPAHLLRCLLEDVA